MKKSRKLRGLGLVLFLVGILTLSGCGRLESDTLDTPLDTDVSETPREIEIKVNDDIIVYQDGGFSLMSYNLRTGLAKEFFTLPLECKLDYSEGPEIQIASKYSEKTFYAFCKDSVYLFNSAGLLRRFTRDEIKAGDEFWRFSLVYSPEKDFIAYISDETNRVVFYDLKTNTEIKEFDPITLITLGKQEKLMDVPWKDQPYILLGFSNDTQELYGYFAAQAGYITDGVFKTNTQTLVSELIKWDGLQGRLVFGFPKNLDSENNLYIEKEIGNSDLLSIHQLNLKENMIKQIFKPETQIVNNSPADFHDTLQNVSDDGRYLYFRSYDVWCHESGENPCSKDSNKITIYDTQDSKVVYDASPGGEYLAFFEPVGFVGSEIIMQKSPLITEGIISSKEVIKMDLEGNIQKLFVIEKPGDPKHVFLVR